MTNLIVRSLNPLNAEPTTSQLRASYITPAENFYIRCHGAIPQLDPATHRLTVTGLVATPLSLSLADLQQRFTHHTQTAILQCAGNRRADLQAIRPTTGDPWAAGAIGHAAWTGVLLADILEAAGADADQKLHVAFDAADVVDLPKEGRFTYGVSIPAPKASDALLVWAMNGEPLRPEHGAPLRVIVPGYAGVRSAKWLTAVTVQDQPSSNHMQQRDYKLLPGDVTEDTVDWTKGATINDMPLTAAICEPEQGAMLKSGPVIVKGYAVASGRAIARVELSADNGVTWRQAELQPNAGSPWSWVVWCATLTLEAGDHELIVRAWDTAGQTQPESPEQVWNFKGYLCASWHRVQLSAR